MSERANKNEKLEKHYKKLDKPQLFHPFDKWYVQISILLITLLLYLLTNNLIFGFIIVIEIFFLVSIEIKQGATKHGWKNELFDTLVALIVALGIWYGASFILHTSSPISAVVSCSMLPNLQRGDFVIVQGADINAYEISMSESDLSSIKNDAIINYKNQNQRSVKGSLYSYCVFVQDQICQNFYEHPEDFTEKKGPLTFYYSRCEIATSTGSKYVSCVTNVSYNGKIYSQSKTNDIIVYSPSKNEIYSLSGDIVHRLYFKIITDAGSIYYLTKGDNNPILDVQTFDYSRSMGNDPIASSKVKGKVLLRVPYLGYFKLFISGFFQEPSQCKTQLKY